MPKIKLRIGEIHRISMILKKEVEVSKKDLINLKNQNFKREDSKQAVVNAKTADLQLLELIKEKFDLEIFAKKNV
jgi:hypothetical protein